MIVSPLGLNLDFSTNGSAMVELLSFRKCHLSLNFRPKISKFSFIFALLIALGVGMNLRPFDKREISASLNSRFDKLTTFLLTNLPSSLSLPDSKIGSLSPAELTSPSSLKSLPSWSTGGIDSLALRSPRFSPSNKIRLKFKIY